MNPIFFNCLLMFVMVILLALVQTRLKLFTDSPLFFFLLVFVMPFLVLGKLSRRGATLTWTELTAFEIFFFTLMLAYGLAKWIVPKVNEGYIYAYTLFHWYLLIDTIQINGFNFWTVFVIAISLYPTYLIIRASFESKILEKKVKIILYYWFLFTIAFTYIDQVALDIIEPVQKLREIGFANSLVVLVSAIQVYFVSTILSLLFVATPVFHLDRSSDKFSIRWKRAKRESLEILHYKLDNYIEYQISFVQFFYITILSGILFWIDANSTDFRVFLVFIYMVLLPLVFFYFKWTPGRNIDEGGINF